MIYSGAFLKHSHHYVTREQQLQMKDYKREKQFHFKNYILEIPCSSAKMRAKSAPQKLTFSMAKAI